MLHIFNDIIYIELSSGLGGSHDLADLDHQPDQVERGAHQVQVRVPVGKRVPLEDSQQRTRARSSPAR